MQTLEDDDCVLEYLDDNDLPDKAGMQKKEEKLAALFELPKAENILRMLPCFYVAEILIQGTMLVTENHICFTSNIPGLRRNIKIDQMDIVDITREKVYAIFPTGLGIATSSDKFVFSHVSSRDKLYRLVKSIWENYDTSRISNGTCTSEEGDQITPVHSRKGSHNAMKRAADQALTQCHSAPTFSGSADDDDADSGVNTSGTSVSAVGVDAADDLQTQTTRSSIENSPTDESLPASQSFGLHNHSKEDRTSTDSKLLLVRSYSNFIPSTSKLIILSMILLLLNAIIVIYLCTRLYRIQIKLNSFLENNMNQDEDLGSASSSDPKTNVHQLFTALSDALSAIQSHLVLMKSVIHASPTAN